MAVPSQFCIVVCCVVHWFWFLVLVFVDLSRLVAVQGWPHMELPHTAKAGTSGASADTQLV